MNKNQKIILAIFIPIIIFFVALMIANMVGTTQGRPALSPIWEKYFGEEKSYPTYTTHDPFDWEKTWYVWLIFLIFCCIFEYKLFADKKRKIIKN